MSESKTTTIIVGSGVVISGLLIVACVGILQVRAAVESSNTLAEEIRSAIDHNNALAESTNTHLEQIAANTSDHGWEYDVVSIPDLDWETKGQQLGMDGWEIITARRASGMDDSYSYECIVRRPARNTSKTGDGSTPTPTNPDSAN